MVLRVAHRGHVYRSKKLRRRRAFAPLAVLLIILLLFAVWSGMLGSLMDKFVDEKIQVDGAKLLTQRVNNFEQIDVTGLSNTLEIRSKINQAIKDVNRIFGSNFEILGPNDLDSVEEFLPLVEEYNGLVHASKSFDEKNPGTAKEVYVSAFNLAGSVALMKAKIAYKVGFKVTGFINNLFHLQKARELCGSGCYRTILSRLHWFVRDNVPEVLREFEQWAKVASA